MWSGIVVIEKIPLQNSSKMLFGKYNHVVETLASDIADQAFGVWILQGECGAVITSSIRIPATRR
jgi:hypothetical protein